MTTPLRGSKGGQRGLSYLLAPANYVLAQRPSDADLKRSVDTIRFYTEDKDRGRAWRSSPSVKDITYIYPPEGGPNSTEYHQKVVIFKNEEALKECATLVIARLFGIDYSNPPVEPPTAAMPLGHPLPPGFGPPPFTPGGGLHGLPNFSFGGVPFGAAFPFGTTPVVNQQPFSYGPSLPEYASKIDMTAPFNEFVPYAQKKALASYLGVTLSEMLKSWEAIERDFDLPNVPYKGDRY